MEEKSESRPPGYQVSGMTPAPPAQHRHDLVVVNIPPGQATPVPWLVIQQTAVSPDYRHNPSVALGSTLIAVGSLSIILNIISVTIMGIHYGSMTIGNSFWCGIMCILAGVFGVLAGKTKSICQIRTCMVLSIFAACLCLGQLIAAIVGCLISPMMDILVIQIFMVILALVGGIAAIILSSRGCRAGACCCSDYYKQYRLTQDGVPMQMATQPDGKCGPVPYPEPAPPCIVHPTQQPTVSYGEDVPPECVPLTRGSTEPAPPRIVYPTQQRTVWDGVVGEDVPPPQFIPLTRGSTGAYGQPNPQLARPISNISTNYVAPPDED